MTRFARAKGSKSSNLKAPDDSTPWEVMKEQMLEAKKESEDNKNRQLAENQRVENYSNFLKEQKIQKRKATWCEFPETEHSKQANQQPLSNEHKSDLKSNENKNKLKKPHVDHAKPIQGVNDQEIANSDIIGNISNKKKKKNSKSAKVPLEAEQSIQETVVNKEYIKHKKERTNKKEIKTEKVTLNSEQNGVKKELVEQHDKKANKKKSIIIEKVNLDSEQNIQETGGQIEQKEEKANKNNKNKQVSNVIKEVGINNQSDKQINGAQKQKKRKKRGGEHTRRKEINDRSFQLIINGKEVELMRFDGFPIMKKDAERLNELKSSMMKKGIPKSEVNRTIKLERRRAEKALARLKRDVCYNCRKGGHNLSDCPELKSNIPGVNAADGVCFKCGSTEHRQFECKVQRDKEFRFASCFICKEQGHIARQCPDNPKGLYPNGGSCNLCGDVTHLRKDCPTVQNKKEGTSIKLQTLNTASNIEDIDLQSKTISMDAPKKPKKIKF